MKATDFARSFLLFRIDTTRKTPITVTHKPPFTVNNARIPIECRCEINDQETGQSHEFVLGASCKTERVNVARNIWTEPNADFVPVFSAEKFMYFKSYDCVGKEVMSYPSSQGSQPERQTLNVSEAFDHVRIDLVQTEAETLEAVDQIIESVLTNRRLVARTEIRQGRYRATIEYPVKTINVSREDQFYQTDTGPLLLPDLSRGPDDLISGFELAYSAFNCSHWTEFIVRTVTPISEGISVYHYSRAERLNTRNQIIQLPL